MSRTIRAPRGTALTCRGWLQEAALRMLMNNLDPDVAEDPANLVVYGGTGKAARTWDDFRRLEALGLTMYGQMTAGSWIYIGTQGIVQGTYETFAAIAEQRFGGSLRGRVCLTAGLGGMGGAQPLAITMNEGVALCVEVDPDRIERRIAHRYLDERIDDLDGAIERAAEAKRAGDPLSVGI